MDLRAQAVLLEGSLKRFEVSLFCHQRSYPHTSHFRDRHVPLPIEKRPQKEILESSLTKEATVNGDVSLGFFLGGGILFISVGVFFYLF